MNSFGVIDLGGKGQLLFLWNVLTWFSKNNGQHYPNNFFRQLVVQKQPPEVFYKKDVLTNFTKFTEKHLCQGLFFNKVAGTGVSCEFCEITENTFFYKAPLDSCFRSYNYSSQIQYSWQKQPLEVLCKKGPLKNFENFTGTHRCCSIFLIKLQTLRPAPATLLKHCTENEVFH